MPLPVLVAVPLLPTGNSGRFRHHPPFRSPQVFRWSAWGRSAWSSLLFAVFVNKKLPLDSNGDNVIPEKGGHCECPFALESFKGHKRRQRLLEAGSHFGTNPKQGGFSDRADIGRAAETALKGK